MTFGDILSPETESCGRDDTVQGLSQRGMFPFEGVCIHFELLAKKYYRVYLLVTRPYAMSAWASLSLVDRLAQYMKLRCA